MKVLYGVQGTGNGHITRARVMAAAFESAGIEVDWVFSGRDRNRLFDMEVFGDYRVCRGLTFQVNNGRIDLRRTMNETSMPAFWRESRSMDVRGYDRVVTDFEPVVAWSARRQGVPCIGIGHQYAFQQPIPKAGQSLVADTIMRWFAPVTVGLGVHWYHFDADILPPIIEPVSRPVPGDPARTLVYLPFENSWRILALLNHLGSAPFVMHCGDIPPGRYANVMVRGFSREGFKQSLSGCGSVICNAGFELASEALAMGKRILVKPLRGQMEQASNALALESLGLGSVTRQFSTDAITTFLRTGERRLVRYPDVAAEVVDWLVHYPHRPLRDVVERLWARVEFPQNRDRKVA